MVKLLVFAILLASSPATGLIESLFRAENTCYSGCQSNYATDEAYLDACKKGCDFRLHNEDCATQCLSYSADTQTQSSCQVGCTLNQPAKNVVQPQKPIVAVDPVPNNNNPEPERPRSIILIRLRQRPSIDMPSLPNLFNGDPSQFFNNIVKQFQEKASEFEQSVRQSFEEKTKDLSQQQQQPSDLNVIPQLLQRIPIIRLPSNIRADSSSESSEQVDDKRPLIEEFKHVIQHPRDHQQYIRERVQPVSNRVQQFFTDVRTEWNDLVRKQPKIPVWIFLAILLTSSVILWHMVMSLCRHTPSRDLSVRAQELIFNPYEYETFEKEKIQPDDQTYHVNDSFPIKVKLTNI